MTTSLLRAQIMKEEGFSLAVYPDPLSGGKPYTVGWGHCGPEVHPGDVWSQAACDTALTRDLDMAEDHLDAVLPWWRHQDDVRQDVLVDMCFNLGIGDGASGLSGFHHFLNYCRTGQYDLAAQAMLESHWAEQVGDRATFLAYMMKHGSRPDS